MGFKRVSATELESTDFGIIGGQKYKENVKGGVRIGDGMGAIMTTLNENFNIGDGEIYNAHTLHNPVKYGSMVQTLQESLVIPITESQFGLEAGGTLSESTDMGAMSVNKAEAIGSIEAYVALMEQNRISDIANDANAILNESVSLQNGHQGLTPQVQANGDSMASRLYGMRAPFITRNWIGNIMKLIIPTEVPTESVFRISEKIPLIKLAGDTKFKHAVDVFSDQRNLMAKSERTVTKKFFPMPIEELNLVEQTDGCSMANNDGLNKDLEIKSVRYSYIDKGDKVQSDILSMNAKASVTAMNGGTMMDKVLLDETGSPVTDKDNKVVRIKIQVVPNYATGLVDVLSSNKYCTEVQFAGTIRDSYNNFVTTVDWTLVGYDVSIPMRPHISVAITPDKKIAMQQNFNISFQTESLELMHETLAQQEDAYMLNFLRNDMDTALEAANFNKVIEIPLAPASTLTPADPRLWVRQNLKDMIDDQCYYMQDVLKENKIMFVIYGNPRNAKFLDDSAYDWKQGRRNQNGINMEHNIWYSNNQRDIKVVTSNKFDESEGLQMIVIPLVGNKLTYKHFQKDYYMTDQLRTKEKITAPHITITKSYETINNIAIHSKFDLVGINNPTTRYKMSEELYGLTKKVTE